MRPDSWNYLLLLHVLGAIVLVGGLLTGVAALAFARGEARLLRLVQEHRSTIIFVNNRRGAERLAVRLNDLAAEESERANGGAPAANGGGGAAGAVAPEGGAPAYIARAHHGSLAREERLIVERLG